MNTISMPGQAPRAIFFDLDGTLIDSLPDLSAAVDLMLLGMGLPAAGQDKVRSWLGNGAEKLVLRALKDAQVVAEEGREAADSQDKLLAEGLAAFFQAYDQCSGQQARLFPGVLETLQNLQARDLAMCVITNKAGRFTPQVLASHGLDAFFPLVLSGDSLAERKPSPLPLRHALAHFGLAPAQALMVGDSRNDILAAQAAGMASVCVTYGYNHGLDPRSLPASAHIDHFPELTGLIPP